MKYLFIEFVSFNNVDSPSITTQIMLKNEIQYLERVLSSLLDDFKSQINSLVQLHELE